MIRPIQVSCSDFVKYGSRGVGAIAGLPPSRGSHAQLSGMAEMQPSAAMYQNAAPILTKGRHGALNIAPGFTPGSPSSDPGLSCGSSPSPSFEGKGIIERSS